MIAGSFGRGPRPPKQSDLAPAVRRRGSRGSGSGSDSDQSLPGTFHSPNALEAGLIFLQDFLRQAADLNKRLEDVSKVIHSEIDGQNRFMFPHTLGSVCEDSESGMETDQTGVSRASSVGRSAYRSSQLQPSMSGAKLEYENKDPEGYSQPGTLPPNLDTLARRIEQSCQSLTVAAMDGLARRIEDELARRVNDFLNKSLDAQAVTARKPAKSEASLAETVLSNLQPKLDSVTRRIEESCQALAAEASSSAAKTALKLKEPQKEAKLPIADLQPMLDRLMRHVEDSCRALAKEASSASKAEDTKKSSSWTTVVERSHRQVEDVFEAKLSSMQDTLDSKLASLREILVQEIKTRRSDELSDSKLASLREVLVKEISTTRRSDELEVEANFAAQVSENGKLARATSPKREISPGGRRPSFEGRQYALDSFANEDGDEYIVQTLVDDDKPEKGGTAGAFQRNAAATSSYPRSKSVLDTLHSEKSMQNTTGVMHLDQLRKTSMTDVLSLMKLMMSVDTEEAAEVIAVTCMGTEPRYTGLRGLGHHVLSSHTFEMVMSLVITLHTVFIGYSTNYALRNPSQPTTPVINGIEVCLLLIYFLELSSKLAVYQLFMYVRKDYMWNILDTFLVIVSFYDIGVILTQANDGSGGGMSVVVLRFLRLLRVAKTFRVFRVMRLFRECRVMLKCITSSMRSLVWCCLMLALFYFLFAVIFSQGIAAHLIDGTADDVDPDVFEKDFSSLHAIMITLYAASTGGRDWQEVAAPLSQINVMYYGLFLFYIAFILVAVLNILTGIFVENAINVKRADYDGRILETIEQEQQVVGALMKLFYSMDVDGDGSLPQDEFTKHLGLPSIWAYFNVIGLDIMDPSKFYKMLCHMSGTDPPDLETFIHCVRRLRGQSRSIDVYDVKMEVKGLADRTEQILLELRQMQGSPHSPRSLVSPVRSSRSGPKQNGLKTGVPPAAETSQSPWQQRSRRPDFDPAAVIDYSV